MAGEGTDDNNDDDENDNDDDDDDDNNKQDDDPSKHQYYCNSNEIKNHTISYSEATNALSLIARTTSTNLILDTSVWPWVMIGWPSGPSQQSTKIEQKQITV